MLLSVAGKLTDQLARFVARMYPWGTHLPVERVLRLGREALWMTIGQALALTGGVAGVRLLTELLPPEAYGELALGLTVASLAQQLIFGPIGNGVLRFYPVAAERRAMPAYLVAARRIMVTATCAVLGGALAFGGVLVAAGSARWVGLESAAVGLALFSGYSGILDAMQNAARQRTVVAWHQGLAWWGRSLLAAGVILLLGASSTAAMWGYGLAIVLVLGSQTWLLRRTLGSAIHGCSTEQDDQERWRKQIWRYSWPFAAWGLATWAQQASDRWALGWFASTQDVACYAVLFQLGYCPTSLASGILVQFISPVLFERASDTSDHQKLQRALSLNRQVVALTVMLMAVGTGLAVWLDRWILRVFAAAEYGPIAYLLPWMVCSGGISAVAQMVSLRFMTDLRTNYLIVPKVVAAILGTCLNVIGVMQYGLVGAVTANMSTSVLYLVLVCMVEVPAKWRNTHRLTQTHESPVQTAPS